jgi:hypothetical protein
MMKQFKSINIIGFIAILFLFSGCRLWEKVFPPKYGCKTDGKNIGAERILSGDPKAIKAAKKSRKFKA